MSLFDLQDVCIAIGSLVTLDLPMVVDPIMIYVLKGPYCTLTTTNWFLQALSVIPRVKCNMQCNPITIASGFTDFRSSISLIVIGPTIFKSPPSPNLNLEAKFSRRKNLPEIVARRRPHGGDRRHYFACGTRPHAGCVLRGLAAHSLPQPAHSSARPVADHRAPSCGNQPESGRPPSEKQAASSRPPLAQPVRKSTRLGGRSLGQHTRHAQPSARVTCARGRAAVDSSIRSTTGRETPSSAYTRRPDEINKDGNSMKSWPEQVRRWAAAVHGKNGGDGEACMERGGRELSLGIQLAVGPQSLRLRNHNFGLAQRIMVKRLATSPHDHLGITDSACKNQLVVVSVQYGPFNPYIPIRSTTNDNVGYPRMSARPLRSCCYVTEDDASGPHPIPPPNDPMTNQYNQDLGLIHSTNGNHLESPNEGSSIDHQVTIYLHAQNITMFPTNETWYFASQILVSSSGGLILVLTAQ
ncbi:hypothetical protein F511_19750 [Dorcoceras hygrometricum]|uniref:Uncharacterized protein n=1 Tax=Dorcoceras hygrometricum TaxID=472368 RepID=A0A2Z7B7R3_9LAMI|nr:hypothetical protein F511_19750 [Dorcoceras hygrometricum]